MHFSLHDAFATVKLAAYLQMGKTILMEANT